MQREHLRLLFVFVYSRKQSWLYLGITKRLIKVFFPKQKINLSSKVNSASTSSETEKPPEALEQQFILTSSHKGFRM